MWRLTAEQPALREEIRAVAREEIRPRDLQPRAADLRGANEIQRPTRTEQPVGTLT